jgi:hypothetical protein
LLIVKWVKVVGHLLIFITCTFTHLVKKYLFTFKHLRIENNFSFFNFLFYVSNLLILKKSLTLFSLLRSHSSRSSSSFASDKLLLVVWIFIASKFWSFTSWLSWWFSLICLVFFCKFSRLFLHHRWIFIVDLL